MERSFRTGRKRSGMDFAPTRPASAQEKAIAGFTGLPPQPSEAGAVGRRRDKEAKQSFPR